MKKFVFGLVLGLFLGAASLALAQLSQGYLLGWDIVRQGMVICQDPYVWTATREIECE